MPHPARVVLLAALLVGCATPGRDDAAPASTSTAAPTAASSDQPTTTTTSSTSTTTSTTIPTSTTSTTVPPPVPDTLRPGDEGQPVAELQFQLVGLGYWLGDADGTYGHLTEQAVMAFQKAEGLDRDGIAGPTTRDRLLVASRPTARTPGVDGIEIDLGRQVLLVVSGGQVEWALNTSTGRSGWSTPAGTFRIDREIDGLRRAPLGDLWRPKYFRGGIAVHGATSIPGHAASHGCARVSRPAMDFLWSSGRAALGTEVRVY